MIEENNDKYIRETDGLIITNVTEADDGTYKCSALVPVTGVYKTRNINVSIRFFFSVWIVVVSCIGGSPSTTKNPPNGSGSSR